MLCWGIDLSPPCYEDGLGQPWRGGPWGSWVPLTHASISSSCLVSRLNPFSWLLPPSPCWQTTPPAPSSMSQALWAHPLAWAAGRLASSALCHASPLLRVLPHLEPPLASCHPLRGPRAQEKTGRKRVCSTWQPPPAPWLCVETPSCWCRCGGRQEHPPCSLFLFVPLSAPAPPPPPP